MSYTKGQKLTLEQVRALSPYYADVKGYMPNGRVTPDIQLFDPTKVVAEDSGGYSPWSGTFYTPDRQAVTVSASSDGSGFNVHDAQNFGSDQDYIKWAQNNNKDSAFDSFMFKAIPALTLAAFGYGGLQATGLLGETAALGTNQVGALGTESSGLLGSSGGFGRLAGSSVGEAFGAGAAPEMGSGLLGQSGALAQGAAGAGYVAPFTSGSITGVSGMPAISAGALGDIAATTGLNTTGLAAGAGVTAGAAQGATPLTPKTNLEKVTDWAKNNPKTAFDLARMGAGLLGGAAASGGSGKETPVTPYQFAPIGSKFQYQTPTFQPYQGPLLFGGN